MANDPEKKSQEDELSGHSYDGIQEYDNPTPGWWNWLFIATIAMAPVYLLVFHSPYQDLSVAAQYDRAYADNLRLQFGEIGDLEPDAGTILKYKDDTKWLAVGEAVFKTNCVTCHGAGGKGISGPNLTDDVYLHVQKVEDIAKVINEGAKAGAMPAWRGTLHPNEIVLAASYVASLHDTNAPGGKAPEGNYRIEAWPELSEEQQSPPPEGEE